MSRRVLIRKRADSKIDVSPCEVMSGQKITWPTKSHGAAIRMIKFTHMREIIIPVMRRKSMRGAFRPITAIYQSLIWRIGIKISKAKCPYSNLWDTGKEMVSFY